MINLRFDADLNLALVKGIQLGYSNYAEERQEKRQSLRISNAFAWVKGNYIDDQVAEQLEQMDIDYTFATAGYTWAYLQFRDQKNKNLILVKNASIVKKKSGIKVLDIKNEDNYLRKISHINSDINFSEVKSEEQELLQFDDLELLSTSYVDANIEQLKAEFERFYILTYAIEAETRMISHIFLWMPELKEDGRVEMVEIDNLTPYLNETNLDINLEAISELAAHPEAEVEIAGSPDEYGYFEIVRPQKEVE